MQSFIYIQIGHQLGLRPHKVYGPFIGHDAAIVLLPNCWTDAIKNYKGDQVEVVVTISSMTPVEASHAVDYEPVIDPMTVA